MSGNVHRASSGWVWAIAKGWTLHQASGRLDIHFVPGLEGDDFLRGRIVAPPVSLSSVAPRLEGSASALMREVSGHFPEPQPYRTSLGPVGGEIVQHLHHTFCLRPGLPSQYDPKFVTWNYEHLREGSSVMTSSAKGLALPLLSVASRRAVRSLNALTVQVLSARYDEVIHEFTEGAPISPGHRVWRCFVSYRKPSVSVARTIRDALAEFGQGAHFQPFFDEHDTRLGNWAEQYLNELSATDVVVPIVTPTYGEEGSFSLVELREAERLNKPIAPIRLPSGENSPVWSRLKKMHACILRAELTDVDDQLHPFFAQILATLEEVRG